MWYFWKKSHHFLENLASDRVNDTLLEKNKNFFGMKLNWSHISKDLVVVTFDENSMGSLIFVKFNAILNYNIVETV